jgi:hypothetical protein
MATTFDKNDAGRIETALTKMMTNQAKAPTEISQKSRG